MNVNSVSSNNSITNTTTIDNTKKQRDVSFDTYMEKTKSSTKEVSLNEIFEEAASKYNVPVNLLKAIGYTESSFRVNATSHCGAQGIMQLMPGTAKSLGVTDAYDPEQNIMGGAKYISSLLKKYEGNTTLALAAYNAGSGNVAKYGGVPPFKETQNYVVKVHKYMNMKLDADQRVVVSGSTSGSVSVNQSPISQYTPVFEQVDEESVIDIKDRLDEIFSYEQYELFLKVLQGDEDKKDSNQNANFSQINMNPAVTNLLKSGNLSVDL